MQLRKEYQDILNSAASTTSFGTHAYDVLVRTVHRCQDLVDHQPRKHLSDAEMMRHFDRAYGMRERLRMPTQQWLGAVRAVVDAAFEKQKERPVVPFDFDKLKTGEWEVLSGGVPTSVICAATLIATPEHYTMRRKA